MASQQPNNGGHNGIAHGHGHGHGHGQQVTLHGPTITPLLPVRQPINGNGYGVPEGGPNNGWSFAGQREPIPGAQQQGNNTMATGGNLSGLGALQNLPRHDPLRAWAGDASRIENPWSDFWFGTANNGQPHSSA
ncbi:hypothetical protein V491_03135 [Pseudogymnoascus sp. VKM F-3775]|nr:hypothetical protein V491_03135 [Pseudogymnoascus sp. VKM F-3775]